MLEIRLLGRFEVRFNGEPVEIPSRPAQSLLAYLILNPGIQHRREKLAGLLWPESDASNARNNLRHALWRLRKVIGKKYFTTDKVSIGFDASTDYELDVDILKDEANKSGSADDLSQAVSAYEGELLPGFYCEWANVDREEIQAVFEDRMQMLLDRLVEEERWREVLKWGERWISLGRSPEPAYRGLMIAHSRLEDHSAVAATYERCIKSLEGDLGIEPSLATQVLYDQLSRGDEPVKIQTEGLAHNLPAQPTPFIGREAELAGIGERLNDPNCQMLTLVGPGGVGKTRLALQTAYNKVGDFNHGVFFIPLSSISSPDFLISAIAETLGFELSGSDDPQVQLLNFLREKEMLLVMDNFDNLIDGAKLLTEIIACSQQIKILVTSRERMNLRGEWLFDVHAMPVPEVDKSMDLAESSVVQLFLQSASRIQAGFSLSEKDEPYVIQICQLVGGMPLGVELAATWVRMLSCKEIAEEIGTSLDFLSTPLKDFPDRHKSMQAVFNSSWELLTEAEKQVYRRLSIFRGGFGREAATRVSGASLSTLSNLADKSFLHRMPGGRYETLELLRQYGQDKLRELPQDEQEISDLQCEFYTELLARWEDALRGGKRREAASAIGIEIDNIRDAWNWAVGSGQVDRLQQSLEPLWLFYDVRSWYKEGFELFGSAIDDLKPVKGGSIKIDIGITIAKLQARQAWFGWRLGKYKESMELSRESLMQARGFDIPFEVAFCLNLQGTLSYVRGSYMEAKKLYQESLSIWREVNNMWGSAISLFNLGQVAHALGEYGEAGQPDRGGMEIFSEIGYQYGATFSFDSLGRVARTLGDYMEAKELCLESLGIRRELDDHWGVAACLDSLGVILCGLGQFDEAKEASLESLEIRRSIGDHRGIATTFSSLGHIAYLSNEYSQAKDYFEDVLSFRRELGDQRGIAASLNMLSNITMILDEFPVAKQYCQESLMIRRELGDKAGIATSLNGLGQIASAMGDNNEAKSYLHEAVATTVEIGALPILLDVLVGLVSCFTKEGEGERAVEWLSNIVQHPACSPNTQVRAKELLKSLASELSTKAFKHAGDRGAARGLDEIVQEILNI